jgi:SAM-dependent methyltransferase
MDWRLKVAMHWVVSLPVAGQPIYRLMQRHVLHTVPGTDAQFMLKAREARRHLDAIRRLTSQPLSESEFYEFGAGWGLEIPLIFWASGVGAQVLVDRRRLTDSDLVAHTINQIKRLKSSLDLQRIPASTELSACGIRYFAPADARSTPLATASVDCITSTDTLEHIPVEHLEPVLRECRRILRPDGLFSAAIDYSDHYQRAGHAASEYNYLKYSDMAWKLFNPPTHYQNRLRHCDYIKLLTDNGFIIVEQTVESRGDPGLLRAADLALKFRRYALAELLPLRAHIVAKPRPS